MAKKNIKTVLKIKEKETFCDCQALILKNSIQYLESGCKMIIDIKENYVTMVRKNEEYEIYFHFQKDDCYGKITLPSKGSIPLDLILEDLKIKEDFLSITYTLNDEKYEYSIYY